MSSLYFFFPLNIASLNNLQYKAIASGVSSFPGTGYVIKFGLQFESTIPIVAIFIFAESLIAVCCSKTLFCVFRKMHKSGNRVTAPNCLLAFVKIPPRQNFVWAYSPHSIAVFSTRWQFCAPRKKKTMTPLR